MQRVLFKIWIGVLALLSAVLTVPHASAASSEAVDTGKVIAQLVSSHDNIEPGQNFHVALKTTLNDHWHTYWRNPGDSGEPVYIQWALPPNVTAGDIIWPLPAPIATGPIINYGFEATPYFSVPFALSSDAQPGDLIEIKAHAYYLVCYDVCIPEDADLTLTLTVGPSFEDVLNKAGIDNAILDAPQRGESKGGAVLDGEKISITINSLPDGLDLSEAYFFPYEQGYILHSEPQSLTLGDDGVLISTTIDYRWEDEPVKTLEGVIRYKRQGRFEGEVVTLNVGSAVPIGAIAASANDLNGARTAGASLWIALIGAFIGGLILNVMPCVFPIISMKALNIAQCADKDIKTVRRDAWAYTAGVFAAFMTLTLILLLFKAGGAQIGWGFQMQSPLIVGMLAVLLFAIGLNLLGVFEIGGGMQNAGSTFTQGGGRRGAFFTGALAVIVATPCTAPFMATAVGYTIGQSALITVIVFTSLAAGFALPFILIAYVPGVLKRLPKPGPWMTRFKEFLSFPMFAATVWLTWVVSEQAGGSGLIILLCAMLLFGLALWLHKNAVKTVTSTAIATALFTVVVLSFDNPLQKHLSQNESIEKMTWSPAAVETAVNNGKTVFVDFTAAWCITCKLNERVALANRDVKARFNDEDVVFMIADWTNKNDEIAAELARHGRAGVPLYLVYNATSAAPMTPNILPQVLDKDKILSALAPT